MLFDPKFVDVIVFLSNKLVRSDEGFELQYCVEPVTSLIGVGNVSPIIFCPHLVLTSFVNS
jgi:hypothetical protein